MLERGADSCCAQQVGGDLFLREAQWSWEDRATGPWCRDLFEAVGPRRWRVHMFVRVCKDVGMCLGECKWVWQHTGQQCEAGHGYLGQVSH